MLIGDQHCGKVADIVRLADEAQALVDIDVGIGGFARKQVFREKPEKGPQVSVAVGFSGVVEPLLLGRLAHGGIAKDAGGSSYR